MAKFTSLAAMRDRAMSGLSGFSGLMGVFSSWTVCHNVCTAAIALLAIIGITVVGMPLLFLQKVAVPFWTAAVLLLGVLLVLKAKKMGCISGNALMLNAGLIVVGTPFQAAKQFSYALWSIGGALVVVSLISMLKGRTKVKNK